MQQFGILFGLPSFLSIIIIFLSNKREALLCLLSPIYFVSVSIMFVVVNMTGLVGEHNTTTRQQQIYYLMISYASLGQFILSTQLVNFIVRILYVFSMTIYLVTNRYLHGDENNLVAAVVLLLYFTLFCESSIYINMKARARLFLKMRTSKQQQKQLLDLLDSMPDSVLLCTKGTPEGR